MPASPAGRESYIKDNLNDITYMSELIPAVPVLGKARTGTAGINSQTPITNIIRGLQFMSFTLHKLSAHLKEERW